MRGPSCRSRRLRHARANRASPSGSFLSFLQAKSNANLRSLSKPLQRLSKLPLLMQALLYHTDAAASYEYERTRAMALEIDALVRSIEDEKIEEEEREQVRDIFARVDGIKDKVRRFWMCGEVSLKHHSFQTLMAPRSSRTVVEEIPIWHTTTAQSPDPPYASSNPRRTVSDAAARPLKASGGRQSSNPVVAKRPAKRLSDLLPRDDKPPSVGSKRDLWLIVFSDVTIRCQRIGETEVPGSFSREKEKQGKQGKVKKGRRRNLYRFLKIERWEMRQVGGGGKGGLVSMEDISRTRRREEPLTETSEDDDDDDDGKWDAESRMRFVTGFFPSRPMLIDCPASPTTTMIPAPPPSSLATFDSRSSQHRPKDAQLQRPPRHAPPSPSRRPPRPSLARGSASARATRLAAPRAQRPQAAGIATTLPRLRR